MRLTTIAAAAVVARAAGAQPLTQDEVIVKVNTRQARMRCLRAVRRAVRWSS